MKTRLYSVVNQYISGIHAGIQTAHAMHEMFIKHPTFPLTAASGLVWEWAVNDKTIIVLNGGYQSNLERILSLASVVKSLPVASFREEQDALNGAMTAVVMVLPEYMYDPAYLDDTLYGPRIANQWCKDGEKHNYTLPEKDLIAGIKALRLKGE